MKAITISQPFASLIASGEKWIENRTWPTNYRGPIAIHAGKGLQYLDRFELAEYPSGCVIAIANLAACERLATIGSYDSMPDRRKEIIAGTNRYWSEAATHKHAEGPWCWILEDVKQLVNPIPYRGSQGLWQIADEAITEMVKP